MPPLLRNLRETHHIGPRCREWVLDREHSPQLGGAPFKWLGHSELRPPYRMVRPHSPHSHVVACFGGRGRTVIDGRLVPFGPGQVLLAPVGVLHAFEVDGAGPWRIAWVFFEDHRSAPVLQQRQAVLVKADAADFVATLQMLTREAMGSAQPGMMEALVAALNIQARRLAGARQVDPRLGRLWDAVSTDLARPWTAQRLAALASVSEEHLRRLCHRHYQRSPMAHLSLLRLQRAATLLRSSPVKIEQIAHTVGYASVYSFSGAFRRWCGQPPAAFRRAGEAT